MGSAYNFNGPNTTVGSAALDGNLSSNRVSNIGGTYTLATGVANGSNFYLRWADTDDTGSDAALAIDNFGIIAVPEPATVFGGILLVGMLGWNQRRWLGGLAGLLRMVRMA